MSRSKSHLSSLPRSAPSADEPIFARLLREEGLITAPFEPSLPLPVAQRIAGEEGLIIIARRSRPL